MSCSCIAMRQHRSSLALWHRNDPSHTASIHPHLAAAAMRQHRSSVALMVWAMSQHRFETSSHGPGLDPYQHETTPFEPSSQSQRTTQLYLQEMNRFEPTISSHTRRGQTCLTHCQTPICIAVWWGQLFIICTSGLLVSTNFYGG